MRQSLAVVSREHHDGGVLQATFSKDLKDPGDGAIQPIHFGTVIRKLLAHAGQIR